MASIVLKDVPREVHRRLKEEAARNRRSMNQEARTILEQGLKGRLPARLPKLVQPKRPISGEMVVLTIRDGRDRCS